MSGLQCLHGKQVCNIDIAAGLGHIGNVKQFYIEFGRIIRQRRSLDGIQLSQEELAKRVGLSRTSITNIEKGRQQVPLHMLLSFADALGMEPSKLLPDKKSLTKASKQVTIDLSKLPSDIAEFVDRVASQER